MSAGSQLCFDFGNGATPTVLSGDDLVGKIVVDATAPDSHKSHHSIATTGDETKERELEDDQSMNASVTSADSAASAPTTLPKVPDRFTMLEDWLLQNEQSQFDSLEIAQFSEHHRGVQSNQEIPADSEILCIPRQYLITVEMGKQCPIGRKMASYKVDVSATKHCYIAVFVLWDRQNSDSFYQPYYKVLPDEYPNMPVFWDDEQLAWLQGSFVLQQVEDRRANIKADYEEIVRACPEFAQFTLDEFCWARMMVASRNFGVKIAYQKTDALVPYADMLNHYRPRETRWTYDNDQAAFTITSLSDLGGGVEVFDSYGKKCNSRFLLNYGFAVDDNSDPDGQCHNEIRLVLELQRDDPAFVMKCRRLGSSFIATSRGIRVSTTYDHTSTREAFSFLRFIYAKEEHLPLFPPLDDERGDGQRKYVEPIDRENEAQVLQHMARLAMETLRGYPTRLQQDLDELESGVHPMGSNRRNVLILLRGEKEICHHYIELAEAVLPMLQAAPREALGMLQPYLDETGPIAEYVHNVAYMLIQQALVQEQHEEMRAAGRRGEGDDGEDENEDGNDESEGDEEEDEDEEDDMKGDHAAAGGGGGGGGGGASMNPYMRRDHHFSEPADAGSGSSLPASGLSQHTSYLRGTAATAGSLSDMYACATMYSDVSQLSQSYPSMVADFDPQQLAGAARHALESQLYEHWLLAREQERRQLYHASLQSSTNAQARQANSSGFDTPPPPRSPYSAGPSSAHHSLPAPRVASPSIAIQPPASASTSERPQTDHTMDTTRGDGDTKADTHHLPHQRVNPHSVRERVTVYDVLEGDPEADGSSESGSAVYWHTWHPSSTDTSTADSIGLYTASQPPHGQQSRPVTAGSGSTWPSDTPSDPPYRAVAVGTGHRVAPDVPPLMRASTDGATSILTQRQNYLPPEVSSSLGAYPSVEQSAAGALSTSVSTGITESGQRLRTPHTLGCSAKAESSLYRARLTTRESLASTQSSHSAATIATVHTVPDVDHIRSPSSRSTAPGYGDRGTRSRKMDTGAGSSPSMPSPGTAARAREAAHDELSRSPLMSSSTHSMSSEPRRNPKLQPVQGGGMGTVRSPPRVNRHASSSQSPSLPPVSPPGYLSPTVSGGSRSAHAAGAGSAYTATPRKATGTTPQSPPRRSKAGYEDGCVQSPGRATHVSSTSSISLPSLSGRG